MVETKTTANSSKNDYDEMINTLFLISELAKKLILKLVKLSLSEMEVKCDGRISTHIGNSK